MRLKQKGSAVHARIMLNLHVVSLLCLLAQSLAAPQAQPNIVILFADDVSVVYTYVCI